MTVRKRLFWSNILMIVVPVVVTAMIGLLCIGFIWLALIQGVGLGIHDQDEFELACEAISEVAELKIQTSQNYADVEMLLDSNQMKMEICEESEIVYSYGDADEKDEGLKSALNVLGENATVTQDNRAMYVQQLEIAHVAYRIYLSGTYQSVRSYANLKTAVLFSAIVIAFTIFVSILVTNRFLTKFVIGRIEEPLDILANGVHELRDGKLDYRIEYGRQDEFTPVCEDFNEMAQQLKDSVEKIRQQERSRKELIAGISHDIRSPLTSIQAYVEGLIDGVAGTPQKQQRYLRTIKQKAEELEQIVSQLFLFSKMELGEYVEHPCLVKLDEAIRRMVEGIQEEYKEKGLEITMELEAVTVWADSVQLERVIGNILGNSLKYKKKEIGHAHIKLEETGQTCRLSVSDDGMGVPEEAIPHLFEVFYRSDPSRQHPAKGSGLGLAIVANIVGRMNGTVAAKNGEDGGLEISMTFPIIG